PVERSRPRPSLPDVPTAEAERPRPRLPDGAEGPEGRERRERRDWRDPSVREEMRARMEERRQMREAALDTNQDGVVSPEERLKPVVERFDANGDGKLTVE